MCHHAKLFSIDLGFQTFLPGLAWNHNARSQHPMLLGMTGACHHIQLFVEMGLANFLPRLASNCDVSPPSS
jgi:hypothetical protein